jgi:hypothetical protein
VARWVWDNKWPPSQARKIFPIIWENPCALLKCWEKIFRASEYCSKRPLAWLQVCDDFLLHRHFWKGGLLIVTLSFIYFPGASRNKRLWKSGSFLFPSSIIQTFAKHCAQIKTAVTQEKVVATSGYRMVRYIRKGQTLLNQVIGYTKRSKFRVDNGILPPNSKICIPFTPGTKYKLLIQHCSRCLSWHSPHLT